MNTNKWQNFVERSLDRQPATGGAAAPGLVKSGRPMSKRHLQLPVPALMLGLVLALFAVSLSSAGTKPASAEGEPPDVVFNRYRAALNLPDLDLASQYVADTFQFTLGYESGGKRFLVLPSLPWAGFRQLLSAGRTTMVVQSETVSGATATGRYEAMTPYVAAAGLDRIVASYQVVVKDGKITSLAEYLDTDDEQTAKFLTFLMKSLAPAPPATGTGVASPRGRDLQLSTMAGAVLLLFGATIFVRLRRLAR